MIARAFEATINEQTELDLDRPTEEMPPFAHPEEELPTELNGGDPLLGTALHGMRLEKLIGEGAAARIYLATHRVLEREYAVKILHQDSTENRELIERMRREAKLLSRIDHPNIVKVYDFGETSTGQPFIAMEMLRGKTLKSVIEHEAPLPRERSLLIAKQVVAGLMEAHRCGLVHRDLKPENVMLVGGRGVEVAKILDFGLAREYRAPDPVPELTNIDMLLGTPRYMAPEQILAPSSAGPASDLYALGVMLYEMLNGKPPFNGAVFEVIEQQLNRAPNPLTKPGPLERITMRLLDKDPAVRPGSASEVMRQLDDVTPPDRSPTLVRPPAPPLPRRPKKSSTPIAILALALAIIGFTLVLLAGYAIGERSSPAVVMVLPESDQPMKQAPSPR